MNHHTLKIVIVTGLMLAVPLSYAHAGKKLDDACIKATGFPVSGGVTWNLMKVDDGLKLCQRATAAPDAAGEAWAALGRTLWKKGNCDQNGEVAKLCQSSAQAYQKAIELRAAEGYFGLGYFYDTGVGRPTDSEKAKDLYRKAIKLKPTMGLAHYNLSRILEYENNKNWRKHHKRALELGNDNAMAYEGEYYVHGKNGYPKKVSKGLRLLKKAAKLRNSIALNELGDIYYYGDVVREDMRKAEKYFLETTSYGSGYGAYSVATIYKEGRVGRPDREKAKKYYLLGHKWGDCNDPLTAIGDLYYERLGRGKALAPNYKEAAKWYRKAVEDGEHEAIFRLVTLYRRGLGVKQDDEKADRLASLLAERPDQIARLFETREDATDKEKDEVIYFHQKAADMGVAKSYEFLAKAYSQGYGNLKYRSLMAAKAYLLMLATDSNEDFSPTSPNSYLMKPGDKALKKKVWLWVRLMLLQMQKASLLPSDALRKSKKDKFARYVEIKSNNLMRERRLAFLRGPKYRQNWVHPSDGGFYGGQAYYSIGSSYFLNGDNKMAFQWMRRCALAGHPICLANMASMYAYGEGVTADIDKAKFWIEQGQRDASGYALAHYGELYESGKLGPVDLKKAAELYERSAKLGHPRGQSNYAYTLETGRGVKKDLEQAFYWSKKAADQGQGRGLHRVGVFYDNGYFVKTDKKRALAYFKEARKKGYAPAIKLLKKRKID